MNENQLIELNQFEELINKIDLFLYDEPLSKSITTMLFDMVCNCTVDQVQKGVNGLITSYKYRNPSIQDILGYIKRNGMTEQELEAYAGLVFESIDSSFSVDYDYVFADARACVAFYSVLKSVKYFGGVDTDKIPYLKKEFVKTYCDCPLNTELVNNILQNYSIQFSSKVKQQDDKHVTVFVGNEFRCNQIASAVFGVGNYVVFKKKQLRPCIAPPKQQNKPLSFEERQINIANAIKMLDAFRGA